MRTPIVELKLNPNRKVRSALTDEHGKFGIDIREYVESESFTGYTKKGVRIPVALWGDCRRELSSDLEGLKFELELSESESIFIQYKNDKWGEGIDFRTYLKLPTYEGYSKKGLRLPINAARSLISALLRFQPSGSGEHKEPTCLPQLDFSTVKSTTAESAEEQPPDDAKVIPLNESISDIKDIQGVLHEAFGIESKYSDTHIEFNVPMEMNRTQKVYLYFNEKDSDGDDIYHILTICAPYNTTYAAMALEQNLKMSYGAIAVKEINGDRFFVALDTQLVKTAQVTELVKSILCVAQHGDALEMAITGKDVY